MTSIAPDKPIALALSGGGVRAIVFHIGVLQALAEKGELERVSHISSVSGGSLLTGLVLNANDHRWPSSQQFLGTTLPELRSQLCSRSLMLDSVSQLLNPWNWRFVLSRANLLGLALQRNWGVTGCLRDLPAFPEWSINGTTAENGKRFRFKAADMGDYTLGYTADNSDFPLAQAMAVSAAFPGGFGPLVIDPKKFCWRKRPWGAATSATQQITLPFKRLHLYDGGVYDNLGLEPLFDSGRARSKIGDASIVVSDAGAPLKQGFAYGPLSVFRLKRVADIMSDQARALRVRTFASYALEQSGRGQLIYIGTPGRTPAEEADAEFAKTFPTTLRRLDTSEFDRIAAHGLRLSLRHEPVVEF